MRYITLIILCLLLASCFKYIDIDNSLRYTVTGFQNLTVDQNDSCTLYVSINLLSGDPANEYITTTVTGIPANVSVNQDSLVFRPNYTFALTFYGHSPTPGIYPINVVMSSPSVGTKTYTFYLTVTSLFDCTAQITTDLHTGYNPTEYEADTSAATYGRFNAEAVRTGCDTLSFSVYYDSIPPGGVGSPPEQFPIQGFNAVINCSANTLYIYPQTAGQPYNSNALIRGSGTYTATSSTTASITINDTVYAGSQIISVNTVHIY